MHIGRYEVFVVLSVLPLALLTLVLASGAETESVLPQERVWDLPGGLTGDSALWTV